MNELNINEVRLIVEIVSYQTANEYINLGWVLLGVAVRQGEGQYISYSLGWAKPEDPVCPRTKYF